MVGSQQQGHSDVDESGSDSEPEVLERMLGWDSWSGVDSMDGVARRSTGWDMVSTQAGNWRSNQPSFSKTTRQYLGRNIDGRIPLPSRERRNIALNGMP
jgi:hypothetical protein